MLGIGLCMDAKPCPPCHDRRADCYRQAGARQALCIVVVGNGCFWLYVNKINNIYVIFAADGTGVGDRGARMASNWDQWVGSRQVCGFMPESALTLPAAKLLATPGVGGEQHRYRNHLVCVLPEYQENPVL